jgi:hypothetical protein
MESGLETKDLIFITGVNSSIRDGEPVKNSFAAFIDSKDLLSHYPSGQARRLVCIDYSRSVGREIRRLGLRPKNCTLIRMEPSVVLPDNFSRFRSKQFGQVITVGGNHSSQSNCVHWPLVWPKQSEIQAMTRVGRLDRIVLINGNKTSFVRGELYSLRRKAIQQIDNLDLYGTDWSSKFFDRLTTAVRSLAHTVLSLKIPTISGLKLWFRTYPNSKGPVRDKIATMSRYKYALVIENSSEYMSEKLMEALFAGCIPIYVGPNPENFGIPRDLVIRAKSNISSIRDAVNNAEGWNIDEFLVRLKKFLDSPETRDLWDHEKVYGRLLREVQKNF